jgi:hypothetical protein
MPPNFLGNGREEYVPGYMSPADCLSRVVDKRAAIK